MKRKTTIYKESELGELKKIVDLVCTTDIPQNGYADAQEALEKEAEEAIAFYENEDGLRLPKKKRQALKHLIALKLVSGLFDEMSCEYQYCEGEVFELDQ